MNLTKNQIYIISAVIIAVIVYFMFFRKKKVATVIVAPPATKAESGYYGQQWNWGSGPQEVTKADAMASMSGPAGNSVAGLMESNYVAANNAWPKNPMMS